MIDVLWALGGFTVLTVTAAVAVCVAACTPARSRDRCD